MAAGYRVMGLYPKGHLMTFVRPGLSPQVLPAGAVEGCGDGEEVLVAEWPIARQHPRGRNGTVFRHHRGRARGCPTHPLAAGLRPMPRELRSQVIQARGVISRWDGTTNIIVSDVETVDAKVPMPDAHDWR